MMKWTKPNGTELEVEDLPGNFAMAKSLGWKSADAVAIESTADAPAKPLIGRPPGSKNKVQDGIDPENPPQTESVSALELDIKAPE